jgi:hypothetical protein
MTTVIIRYSKWQRFNLAAAALIFAGLFVFTLTLLSDFSILPILFFVLVLAMGVATFIQGVRAVNAILFRIEFLESVFRVSSFSWRGKKESNHPYADIRCVNRGLKRGEVIVEFDGSTPLKLTPFLYEGKDKRLLSEFEKHLPAEKMEPGLAASLSRFKKYDKITYPLQIGFNVGLYLLCIQMVGVDLLRPRYGWPNEIPFKLGTFYKALSVDEQGAVWFATNNVDTDAVQIGRLFSGIVERWDVPADAFLDKDSGYGISAVIGNSEGFPVVYLRMYTLTWNGEEWKRDPHDPFPESPAVTDASSGSEIKPISYDRSAAGRFLAAGEVKGPITFYRYEDEKWNAVTGPLDLWKPFLLAWTVSDDGTIWVTKELIVDTLRQGYSPGPLAFGHWDAAAEEWRWSVTEAFPESFKQKISNMLIDPRGRVWIAGYYETADVRIGETAAAFAINGEKADLVVRYTDKNSNLQDSYIVQGPGGRLWSAGSTLVSLDASAEELPAPLPEWVAGLDDFKFQWIIIGIVLVMEAAYFIVLGIMNREEKKLANRMERSEGS